MEWHVQPLSLDRFGEPLHHFDAITPSVCNLRPTSRGHVRVRTADPFADPAITTNYLSTTEDQRIAVEGLRFTRRIMAAKRPGPLPARGVQAGLCHGASEEELHSAAGDLGTTIFHPVGTCKMGGIQWPSSATRCRCMACEGLRVCDASIMPLITSGNTNAPTVMIAEKAAEFILEDTAR